MGTRQILSLDGETLTLFISAASPFSNLHPCNFTALNINGTQRQFTSVEKYYLYNKALSTGNEICAEEIMGMQNIKDMKATIKTLKNFNKTKWNDIKVDVMRRGILDKFSQNTDLRQKLFLTRRSILVEANQFDSTWGIGLSIYDDSAADKSNWRGMNMMGNLLTELRNTLWVQPEFAIQKQFAVEQQSDTLDFFSLHFPPLREERRSK